MLKQLKQSRFSVHFHVLGGLLLFGLALYPILSSAETLRERAMMKNEDSVERLENMRTDRADKLDDAREDMRERVKSITDERKAKLAQQLTDQMNALNERLTNHYLGLLARMEAIIVKIETRLAEAGEAVDNAEVLRTIQAAKTKIADVKNAVLTQQAKVYTVTWSSEAKLREAFQGVKKQLQDDHAAMRTLVGQARDAVQAAFEALKTLVKE